MCSGVQIPEHASFVFGTTGKCYDHEFRGVVLVNSSRNEASQEPKVVDRERWLGRHRCFRSHAEKMLRGQRSGSRAVLRCSQLGTLLTPRRWVSGL